MNTELLGMGITTGTCAASAAKAAVLLLEKCSVNDFVATELPDGTTIMVPILNTVYAEGIAEASVQKYSGDDPDITDGCTVVARVTYRDDTEIHIAAGKGVGTVTKRGLAVLPGEPAINPAPREMIRRNIQSVTHRGINVTISIPEGEMLALKTFNPRLGITGGLSILGTTGRVRPYSAPALQAALCCSLDIAQAAQYDSIILVPGHIGARAAEKRFHFAGDQLVEVSNEWGYMIEQAVKRGFHHFLCLGHPGKLAKLAYGEWDTHSSRSQSAVPFVQDMVTRLLSIEIPDALTVEAIFMDLPEVPRMHLGNSLAELINYAIQKRINHCAKSAVVLINLAGDIMGQYGDCSKWM